MGLPRPLLIVLCALVALVAVGSGGAAVQANSVTFPDSTGEDAQGPDITSVVVSNDNRGTITFRINVPNRPTLTGDMFVLVFVDSDANPATGEPDIGSDYAIQLVGPLTGRAEVGLFRWSGSEYTADGVSQTSLIFSYANGAATIRMNARELGATKRFSFVLLTASGVVLSPSGEPDDTNVRVDVAPDAGHGLFSYDVKTTPPSLAIRPAGSSPARPRAGKRYTVFSVVTRADTGAAVTGGRVACRAVIGGRAITGRGSFAGGRARCSFTIPAAAGGKRLRGTMTVSSGGLTVRRTFGASVA